VDILIIALDEADRQVMVKERCWQVKAAAGCERQAPSVFLQEAAHLLGADQTMKERRDFAGGDAIDDARARAAEIVLRLHCCGRGSVLRIQNVLVSLERDADIFVEVAADAGDRAVIDGMVGGAGGGCVGIKAL